MVTAPASVAAACGMDAMIHALEAYLSRNATPFSDAMAEKVLELIGKIYVSLFHAEKTEMLHTQWQLHLTLQELLSPGRALAMYMP
jgi:alcohol dehydrogenase class IV